MSEAVRWALTLELVFLYEEERDLDVNVTSEVTATPRPGRV